MSYATPKLLTDEEIAELRLFQEQWDADLRIYKDQATSGCWYESDESH